MPSNNYNRKGKRPISQQPSPTRSGLPQASSSEAKPEDQSLPGFMGWLVRNRRLLGWVELIAAIFLFWLAVNGFLGGTLYLPFAFGLLGLRFFYAYIQHYLGVNLGKTGMILSMVLLVGALVCAVLSVMTNEISNIQ